MPRKNKAAKQLTAAEIAIQSQHAEEAEVQQAFEQGITTLRDLISPSSIEIHSGYFRLGTKYGRTIYVYGYPRTLYTGWISSLINIDEVLDVSMYVYPVETTVVMKNLRKKVTQLEASYQVNAERGKVRDPEIEAAINDAEELRDKLQVGAEKFFRFGLYITLWADSLDELNFVQHKVETLLGQQMIFSKVASAQQEQGMNSTMPQCTDQLQIRRNMNTGAISTSFPFTSADLTQEKGILYGINMHNNGLVIFDRFSLENANLVVFAKSGAGKSFAVKLEALRSMMIGAEILIIDPENEYQKLCDAVGGSYNRLSLNSDVRINPFDLPKVVDSEDANDALRANLVTLHGLFRLMLGGNQVAANGQVVPALTANEEADLDQALIDTYARAGITSDPLTHQSIPPKPLRRPSSTSTILSSTWAAPVHNSPNVFANTRPGLSRVSSRNNPTSTSTTRWSSSISATSRTSFAPSLCILFFPTSGTLSAPIKNAASSSSMRPGSS